MRFLLITAATFTAVLSLLAQTRTTTAPDKPTPLQRAFKAATTRSTLPNNTAFKVTAAELDKLMAADNARGSKEPLSFPKGEGLRILMTGHSFVGPARVSLPKIAEAAGFTGHHQRAHTHGGALGSANSIWLSEIGKLPSEPANTILLPAIATGQWDVMTWGGFYGDAPEHYTQWIDLCLKYNPGMSFYVQDGWPLYFANFEKAGPADALKALDESAEGIQEKLFRPLFEPLAAQYPGKVHQLAAGDAVVRLLHLYYDHQLPALDTVSEHLGGTKGIYRDGGHLSTKSGVAQIVGYVYYATLYKKSPGLIKGYTPAGIDPALDKHLRACAWQAVIHNPFSGVTDKNADGIADE